MSLSDTVADAPSVPAPRNPEGHGRSRRREPRTYDFRRPTKLSREHVRILQIAQENFARQATTTLTSILRTGARMELVGIEQFSY
ncbi:MAG: fliM [Modestobacter sp.]|nr:fliM [Modestobacter sp.]